MSKITQIKKGIASLPVILLLGGIMIEIGIAGAFLLIYLNNSLYGARLASEALEAAHSGINDAVMRVIVDKNVTDTYDLNVGRAVTTVTIEPNSITSFGRAFTKRHTLVAELTINQTTGFVTIDSIQESTQ